METTPVFSPGKSHGQRSLVGYSSWSRRVKHNSATDTSTFHVAKSGLDKNVSCSCLSALKTAI